jgi:hypothetical protein
MKTKNFPFENLFYLTGKNMHSISNYFSGYNDSIVCYNRRSATGPSAQFYYHFELRLGKKYSSGRGIANGLAWDHLFLMNTGTAAEASVCSISIGIYKFISNNNNDNISIFFILR